VTTYVGLLAVCVLAMCLCAWIEGGLTPARRDTSALAAAGAVAALVVYEGWWMTLAVTIILSFFYGFAQLVGHVMRVRSGR
jgi:hypothetical protein